MRSAKAASIVPLFIEDTDKIDHHIATRHGLREGIEVVDVTLDKFKRGQHQQVAMSLTPPSQHTQPMALFRQTGTEVMADKATAAEDTDGVLCHGLSCEFIIVNQGAGL